MKIGAYYMHEKHMDVCVRVVDVHDDGKCVVEWYNLGYVGQPWPLGLVEPVYINGNWQEISKLVHVPRKEWPTKHSED